MRADTAARHEADRKRAMAARRNRGSVSREAYLAEVQRRRVAASRTTRTMTYYSNPVDEPTVKLRRRKFLGPTGRKV